MRELKKEEIKDNIFEIMCEFTQYCDEHGLRYYMCGGTLLGAIRHKGFIPWDDDVDLLMPRPDFDKLHELIKKEPIKSYYELTGFNARNGDTPFAKVVDRRTRIDSKYLVMDKNLWIDIFPMDGLPDDEKESDALLTRTIHIRKKISRSYARIGSGKGMFRTLFKIPAVILYRIIGAKTYAKQLDTIARRLDFDKCEYVGGITWSLGKGERMKKSEYIPYEDKEFNGRLFHAPKCWERYLTQNYGDYMKLPPEEKRITHDFTAYIED